MGRQEGWHLSPPPARAAHGAASAQGGMAAWGQTDRGGHAECGVSCAWPLSCSVMFMRLTHVVCLQTSGLALTGPVAANGMSSLGAIK